MATLSSYLTSTRRLLGDLNKTLYSDGDLTAYINEARHQRDLDTRLVRRVVSLTLTAQQITYSLATVAAGALIRGDATAVAKDILSIHVLPQGGVAGGVGLRYPLARWPYSRAAFLCSTSWPSYPRIYARIGTDGIVLAPPPQQAYAAEWDLIGVWPDLVNTTDADPMPDPYNDPLPYLAAAVAKYGSGRLDEGQVFEALYGKRMPGIRQGVRQLAVSRPAADLPRR